MAWTEAEKRAVRSQLESIGLSAAFQTAGRMAALLDYLVDAELKGDADRLNQSRIAIDVLGRDAKFDPSADSIVRVEVGRLRSKLLEYYAGAGKNDAVFVELPKGRYKPILAFRGTGTPAGEDFRQDIKFCKAADGTALAYAISGEGPPLLKASNWMTHLEFDVQSPVWQHWWVDLSKRHRLIRYDPRGCGLSDWDVGEISFEKWISDLETVADAAALEKFALLGSSQGAAIAIAYAVRHPERVSHLVLYGGYVQGQLERNDPVTEEAHRLLQDIVRIGWGKPHGAFRQVFGSMFMPDGTSDQFRWFDELSRISMSTENALMTREAAAHVDIGPLLAQVRVPAIVLHAADEIVVPFSQARMMAAGIPGARLVSLDSKNHILFAHEPAWKKFVAEVEAFVR
ncbi:MAG: alpha/beta hydrolase [Alphaproteobacteria bacterium]